jgi:hypothetical protein
MKAFVHTHARRGTGSVLFAVAMLAASLALPAIDTAFAGDHQDADTQTNVQDQIDRNQAVQVFHTFRRPTELSNEPSCQGSIHCYPPDHSHQH